MSNIFIHENPEEDSALCKAIKWIVMLVMLAIFLQMSEIASATQGSIREAETDLEHYGIFFQMFLLVIGMVVGYALEHFHVTVSSLAL